MVVKRWEIDDGEMAGVRESECGDWVDYEDFAALEQRCGELEAENERLRKRLEPREGE